MAPLWPCCSCPVAPLWPCCSLAVAALWDRCGRPVAQLYPRCGPAVAALWPAVAARLQPPCCPALAPLWPRCGRPVALYVLTRSCCVSRWCRQPVAVWPAQRLSSSVRPSSHLQAARTSSPPVVRGIVFVVVGVTARVRVPSQPAGELGSDAAGLFHRREHIAGAGGRHRPPRRPPHRTPEHVGVRRDGRRGSRHGDRPCPPAAAPPARRRRPRRAVGRCGGGGGGGGGGAPTEDRRRSPQERGTVEQAGPAGRLRQGAPAVQRLRAPLGAGCAAPLLVAPPTDGQRKRPRRRRTTRYGQRFGRAIRTL